MLARLLTASALVLVAGCSAGTDPDVAAPQPPPPAASAPATTPAPSPTPPISGTVIEVTYAGGKVTGVEPRVSVALGEPVLLRVTSDVAEQIHVHGYDVVADIPAGGTAEVEFGADLAGSWEVELHDAGRPMFQLRVS
jgi:hypothetical protein